MVYYFLFVIICYMELLIFSIYKKGRMIGLLFICPDLYRLHIHFYYIIYYVQSPAGTP